MKICYVNSKSALPQRLERTWNNNAYNLTPFQTENDLQNVDAVCLVEPYEVLSRTDDRTKRGVYLSIFPIWKRYLARMAPRVKLLLLRYTDVNHPNIVPILSLHPTFDWAAVIKRAYPNSELWEKEIDEIGTTSAQTKLKVFFKGHNRQGFVDVVARVRQKLNHVYHELYHQQGEVWKALWEEQLQTSLEDMRLLYHRWSNYEVFFRVMPFWDSLTAFEVKFFLSALVRTCSQAYPEQVEEQHQLRQVFINLNAYEKLDKIQTKLKFLNKKYINPDELGTVLIIDDDRNFHKILTEAFPSFMFLSAYTEQEGRECIERLHHRVSFVILDMRLVAEEAKSKGREGLAILEWSKQTFPNLPIIIISTSEDARLQLQTIKLGAAYFLNKSSFSISNWSSIFLKCFAENDQQTKEDDRILNIRNRRLTRAHILLIDDNVSFTEETTRQLAAFSFIVAHTARQARDRLFDKANDFALILADIILEDDNEDETEGIQLIEEIRGKYPNIPLIAISRRNDIPFVVRTLNAGAMDFWPKNQFHNAIWEKRIDNYIKLKQKESNSTTEGEAVSTP